MAPLRLRHLLLLSAALASARSHGSIFDAVAADSMQKLKAALEADPSALDVTGPGGQSPLMHAVLTGKAKAVKYLLKRGADVTVPEKAPRRRTLHRERTATHIDWHRRLCRTGTLRCMALASRAAQRSRGC